jgi:hypothetical protein
MFFGYLFEAARLFMLVLCCRFCFTLPIDKTEKNLKSNRPAQKARYRR